MKLDSLYNSFSPLGKKNDKNNYHLFFRFSILLILRHHYQVAVIPLFHFRVMLQRIRCSKANHMITKTKYCIIFLIANSLTTFLPPNSLMPPRNASQILRVGFYDRSQLHFVKRSTTHSTYPIRMRGTFPCFCQRRQLNILPIFIVQPFSTPQVILTCRTEQKGFISFFHAYVH